MPVVKQTKDDLLKEVKRLNGVISRLKRKLREKQAMFDELEAAHGRRGHSPSISFRG